MLEQRLTALLRPVLTLTTLALAASLAGCGGGGGSPSNPYSTPATPPALTVLPSPATVYSGVPSTLTITSGTAPFSAFSSNSTVLPVASQVSTTVPLLAAPVAQDESVTVTIRDASGQSVGAAVTVKPSLLLPASITITGNPICAPSGAQLCSGQDGTATVKVTSPSGAGLAGRPVRFDVILGNFGLIANNATIPAQSVTVTSDQNGLAAVTIRIPVAAATQFGTLRATDVTDGSSVIAQFTIAQYINGNTVLSVIPTGTTTFTGPDKQTCSSGAQANFYIFGGTPPYTVATNFPGAVSLIGTPVFTSGGAFAIVTNGTCFTGLTFAITDASGRTLLTPPTADNVVGEAAPTVPLTLVPSEFPVGGGTTTCASGNTFSFLIRGGSGTYSGSVTPNAGSTGTATATVSSGANATSGTVNVAFTSLSHGDWVVNVTDGSEIKEGTIHCS
jgi:hypothetical protein